MTNKDEHTIVIVQEWLIQINLIVANPHYDEYCDGIGIMILLEQIDGHVRFTSGSLAVGWIHHVSYNSLVVNNCD